VVLHVKVLHRRDDSGEYPSWLVQTCNIRMRSVGTHVVDKIQWAARQQVVQEDSQVWLCFSAAEITSSQWSD